MLFGKGALEAREPFGMKRLSAEVRLFARYIGLFIHYSRRPATTPQRSASRMARTAFAASEDVPAMAPTSGSGALPRTQV